MLAHELGGYATLWCGARIALTLDAGDVALDVVAVRAADGDARVVSLHDVDVSIDVQPPHTLPTPIKTLEFGVGVDVRLGAGERAFFRVAAASQPLCVRAVDNVTINKSESGGAGGGGDDDSGDSERCGQCGRLVPAAARVLHSLGCRRDTHSCDVCGETTDRASADKHARVRHRRVACALGCGAQLLADEQSSHRRDACPRRRVACLYCPLRVRVRDRGEHQGQCGARSAQCARCPLVARRREMKRHVVEAHGVLPRDIDAAVDWHPVALGGGGGE
eukprot:TRINITY_DN2206_c0_g1_i1.p2 TRINITY_DN2206_c0_g1~~TRINITY_DN2206_c0_g1_i1.p2  ORF type:complete len:277 (+),score=163.33 TRINITY_DN2206_c0_g1_i1:322-1152(+)